MTDKKRIKVKLDWTRLLGFDQATDIGVKPGLTDARMARLGAKVGSKVGVKAPAQA